MFILLFTLIALIVLFIMKRYQNAAMITFFFTLFLASIWYLHHATDTLTIQL